jgi:hypothetical protein
MPSRPFGDSATFWLESTFTKLMKPAAFVGAAEHKITTTTDGIAILVVYDFTLIPCIVVRTFLMVATQRPLPQCDSQRPHRHVQRQQR